MTKSVIFSLIAALVFFSFTGCKKTTSSNKTATSAHNSTSSRKMSGACLNCHTSGGNGPGWWTVADTVYTEDFSATSPNGTINFYSEPFGAGTVVATIEVDANGNFYTSKTILPAAGAYPQLVGTSGNMQDMPALCTSGDCNSCHGVTCAKIWIN